MYCRLYQQCSGHLRLCDFFWAPSSQDESFPAYTTEQYDVFPLRTTWTFIYSALWWILCCDNNPRRSFSLSFGTAQTVFIPNKLLIQSHYSLGRLMFYLVCVCVCHLGKLVVPQRLIVEVANTEVLCTFEVWFGLSVCGLVLSAWYHHNCARYSQEEMYSDLSKGGGNKGVAPLWCTLNLFFHVCFDAVKNFTGM